MLSPLETLAAQIAANTRLPPLTAMPEAMLRTLAMQSAAISQAPFILPDPNPGAPRQQLQPQQQQQWAQQNGRTSHAEERSPVHMQRRDDITRDLEHLALPVRQVSRAEQRLEQSSSQVLRRRMSADDAEPQWSKREALRQRQDQAVDSERRGLPSAAHLQLHEAQHAQMLQQARQAQQQPQRKQQLPSYAVPLTANGIASSHGEGRRSQGARSVPSSDLPQLPAWRMQHPPPPVSAAPQQRQTQPVQPPVSAQGAMPEAAACTQDLSWLRTQSLPAGQQAANQALAAEAVRAQSQQPVRAQAQPPVRPAPGRPHHSANEGIAVLMPPQLGPTPMPVPLAVAAGARFATATAVLQLASVPRPPRQPAVTSHVSGRLSGAGGLEAGSGEPGAARSRRPAVAASSARSAQLLCLAAGGQRAGAGAI